MKRFFICMLLMLGTLVSSAQSSNIDFLDIPISGDVDSFVSKLKEKDFKLYKTEKGISLLVGEYLFQPAILAVSYNITTKQVGSVMVTMKAEIDYDKAQGIIDKYSKSFSLLYGEPSYLNGIYGYNIDGGGITITLHHINNKWSPMITFMTDQWLKDYFGGETAF